ncbi:MAG TPA: 16S rRNA (cytosine(967)-C(5))-methyltransferase RsmB [Aquabacterium sp.]|nr:16S rRNA (cytosine(967)-C(5))-methyltransferase RsmB [Aquabacterium sp.]
MTRKDRSNSPVQAPAGSLPLSQLLIGCADAIAAVQRGQSLNDALSACSSAERPGVQALSFAVLRRLGTALALRSILVPKRPDRWVDGLLLSALALACGTEYSDHTLVDQTVEAAKHKARPAAGLVNAVLRRFLRERQTLMAEVDSDPVAHFNHPDWWIGKLKKDWPDQWAAILNANQEAAPMALRVNRRHTTPERYLQRLKDADLPAWLDPTTGGIVLAQAVPVKRLPGFEEGDVSVQDLSAQRAAPMLLQACGWASTTSPQTRPRVLDACAAPGGKTAHLLELADLDVTALDADPDRLTRVHDNLDRLGLQAEAVAADASRPETWWDGQLFDAILLDAPCSASGIVRRHPDVRWLRRESDIAALARTQDAILDALWPLLKPGGHLLYCTCSVFKEEGQDRVDAFLQRCPQAKPLSAPGHLLPVVEYDEPIGSDPGDGFFYALFTKI